jgi:hypothetical protein
LGKNDHIDQPVLVLTRKSIDVSIFQSIFQSNLKQHSDWGATFEPNLNTHALLPEFRPNTNNGKNKNRIGRCVRNNCIYFICFVPESNVLANSLVCQQYWKTKKYTFYHLSSSSFFWELKNYKKEHHIQKIVKKTTIRISIKYVSLTKSEWKRKQTKKKNLVHATQTNVRNLEKCKCVKHSDLRMT